MDGVIESIIGDLRGRGYLVRRARPGARIPRITEACEAVGLRRLTARPGQTAEAEIFIQVFSPAALGAAACEREAAAIAAAVAAGLGSIPACACQGEECAYDGQGDFSTLRLTMTLPVRLDGDGAAVGQPALILENGRQVATAARWSAAAKQTAEPVYAFGESDPVGISTGETQYTLTLSEIQATEGSVNLALLTNFSLAAPLGEGTVLYEGCTWREFKQVESEGGITIQAVAAAVKRREA